MGLWSPRIKAEPFNIQKAIALQQHQKQQYVIEKKQGTELQQVKTEQKTPDSNGQKSDQKNKKPQYVTPVIGFDIGEFLATYYVRLLLEMNIPKIYFDSN